MREEDESNIRDGWADIEDQRVSPEADRRLPVRTADVAQYAREPIPAADRGAIRVRLLNVTPDPLGSIAALGKQYKGEVVRSLSELTDEERRAYFEDFGKTVLNGPLEAAQFHFQIEGVTRSITHQMVRSRASFFAQESLRFAVPEGNWADEIPLPPSLAGVKIPERRILDLKAEWIPASEGELALDAWKDALINSQNAYERLISLGVPAEEARGVLPHDMPTRIHWVLDLRTLLTESGKRTCTQAQFPWRVIFAGIAKALRDRAEPQQESMYVVRGGGPNGEDYRTGDGWQFRLIADKLRPVCFQTGRCGFMAQFDRNCSIRGRVDRFEANSIPSSHWGTTGQWDVAALQAPVNPQVIALSPIADWEWAADPGAARA